jgi:hypothetical protein
LEAIDTTIGYMMQQGSKEGHTVGLKGRHLKVEVAVRNAGGFSPMDYGVPLMRKAEIYGEPSR